MSKTIIARTTVAAWTLLVFLLMTPVTASEPSPGLDLADYRGKVVVLDFWASWCVPCRRSFPWLNSMNDRYSDKGLVIVGVNLDQDAASAAEFLRDFPAEFQVYYDTSATLAKEFGVQGMPSSYVIGRDGQIKARHLGFKVKRQDEYEAAIVAALQQETWE